MNPQLRCMQYAWYPNTVVAHCGWYFCIYFFFSFQISTIGIPWNEFEENILCSIWNTWKVDDAPSHISLCLIVLSYFQWCFYIYTEVAYCSSAFVFVPVLKRAWWAHTRLPVMIDLFTLQVSFIAGYWCTFYGLSPRWKNPFLRIRRKLKGRFDFHVFYSYCLHGICWLHGHLQVFSWEPVRCHDAVDMRWNNLADLSIYEGKLLGCSYHERRVGVWVADISVSVILCM